MKKIITTIFFLTVIQSAGYAQDVNADAGAKSILHKLDTTRQDTNRVLLMVDLANHYTNISPDSAFFYGYKALALARQINFPKGEVGALRYITWTHLGIGNYSEALQITLRGLKIAERNNLVNSKALFLMTIGRIYNQIEDHRKALDLFIEAKALLDSLHDFPSSTSIQDGIAETYLMMNQPDSALYYCQAAHEKAVQLKIDWLEGITLWALGRAQRKKGNYDLALAYLRQSLLVFPGAPPVHFSKSYFYIAELYQQINKPDSCIYYANKSLEAVTGRGFYPNMIEANILLSRMYERRDPQRALDYSRTAILYKDSLYNLAKTISVKNLVAFDEQERQYEIETAKAAYRSKVKQYGLIGGSLVVLLIGFILYRSNKMRMRHEIVSQQHKASELEMQALRAQMNPHFIFNSLNSINMFILENNKLQASEYLSKFSRLVRLILQNSQEVFIPLERELEALQLYLELESLRFEHRFEYKISVDDEVDTTMLKVPPLIIQPYAENAIWHGLMHKKEKGHLEIELYLEKEILFCKITDDGIGRKEAAELKRKSLSTHKSMGIKITEGRIAIMQKMNGKDESVEIKDLVYADGSAAGTEVVLKIPIMWQA